MTNRGFWTQGETQVGRVLSQPHAVDLSWRQEALFPPLMVEGTLRLGVVPADDHLRWQIEVSDPATKELIAMQSAWGRSLRGTQVLTAEPVNRLEQLLADYVEAYFTEWPG